MDWRCASVLRRGRWLHPTPGTGFRVQLWPSRQSCITCLGTGHVPCGTQLRVGNAFSPPCRTLALQWVCCRAGDQSRSASALQAKLPTLGGPSARGVSRNGESCKGRSSDVDSRAMLVPMRPYRVIRQCHICGSYTSHGDFNAEDWYVCVHCQRTPAQRTLRYAACLQRWMVPHPGASRNLASESAQKLPGVSKTPPASLATVAGKGKTARGRLR